MRKAGISARKLIERPHLVDIIKELSLGNRREIVWAALAAQVTADVSAKMSVVDVIDKLGISATMDEPYYQVTYAASQSPEPPAVPTVFDAGADDRFRPAEKGAGCGVTRPRTGDGEGYPEYVHGKTVVKSADISVHDSA